MYKKGRRGESSRADRTKKRRFKGNQYVTDSERDLHTTNTSAEKLKNKGDVHDVIITREFSYCILNFYTVFSAIAFYVICKTCKKEVKFYQMNNRALGFKISMQCECAEHLINSFLLSNNAYEINRRIVLVMRLLGIGREGINLFCGLIDIAQGLTISGYYACIEHIHIAASTVYNALIKNAVEEGKEKNVEAGNIENNLIVSGDGTWKKRGFSSLFGVTTIIGKYSKKVLDTAVNLIFIKRAICGTKKE